MCGQLRASGRSDDRGWEKVSPVGKNGGDPGLRGDRGRRSAAGAANGDSASFSSTSSFGVGSKGAPRLPPSTSPPGRNGWSTENVTLPTLSGAYGEDPSAFPTGSSPAIWPARWSGTVAPAQKVNRVHAHTCFARRRPAHSCRCPKSPTCASPAHRPTCVTRSGRFALMRLISLITRLASDNAHMRPIDPSKQPKP